MTTRRALLVLSTLLLVSTAGLDRASASRSPGVSLEGDAMASSTSSGWGCGCGPIYRARTAGGAAGVKITEHKDPNNAGVSFEVRGAYEEEYAHYAGEGICSKDTDPVLEEHCGDAASRPAVPDHGFMAGDIRLGWSKRDDAPRERVTLGVLGYTAWIRQEGRAPGASRSLLFWPSAEIASPAGDAWTLKLGTGAPAAVMLRRPGLLYGEVEYAKDGFKLRGIAGWFRTSIGWGDDRRSRSFDVFAASLESWFADPTLTLHVLGEVPLAGGFSLLSGVGMGGIINTVAGRGPDGSVSMGLRFAR